MVEYTVSPTLSEALNFKENTLEISRANGRANFALV